MNKYQICYTTLEGDYSKVWIEAFSEDDARDKLKREYWDVERIDMIQRI